MARAQISSLPSSPGQGERREGRDANGAGVGRGRLTAGFAAFAGLLVAKIHLCRPRDPEAKGLVERANGYLETSFLPGLTFSGPGDFYTQLITWPAVANRRVHRTLQTRPTER
ncbi:hypothetical protein ACFRIB_40700 [Streptomyces mirabilis]|uniref:hypothetical protein n=1 Tax=Streptomyces mirabilis TaxID=68239 RepID=UPI0036AA6968